MGGDPNKRIAVLLGIVPDPVVVPPEAPVEVRVPWEPEDLRQMPLPLDIESALVGIDFALGEILVAGTGITLDQENPNEDDELIRFEAPRVQVYNPQLILSLPAPLEEIVEGAVVTVDDVGNAVICFGVYDGAQNQPVGVCLSYENDVVRVVTQGVFQVEGAWFYAGAPIYVGEDGFLSINAPTSTDTYVAQVGMAISAETVVLNLPITFIIQNH